MPDRKIAAQHHATFENLRHIDVEGNEYWLARQLADVLDYSQYRHFLPVVERAKEACRNSGHPVDIGSEHQADRNRQEETGEKVTMAAARNSALARRR